MSIMWLEEIQEQQVGGEHQIGRKVRNMKATHLQKNREQVGKKGQLEQIRKQSVGEKNLCEMRFFLLGILILTCNICYGQVPTITSFTPASGPVGTTVTISGTNFNTVATNNRVYFGAVRVIPSSGNATSLTVSVPVGATSVTTIVVQDAITGFQASSITSSTPHFTVTTSPTGLPTYSTTTTGSLGTGPISHTTGDFNNDGKVDIAVINNTSNHVGLRMGDGLGGFTGITTVAVGTDPRLVTTGDFNKDGNMDLAVACNSVVSILLGNGLGGFSATSIALFSDTRGVAIGDFNEDGIADFAATSTGGVVSIKLGDGLGGFSGSTFFASGFGTYSISVGDFNGDSKADLATANNGSNDVVISFGDGTGVFPTSSSIPVGTNPRSIVIGDFNKDGKMDFATANQTSNNVSIRLGDGLGGFSGTTEIAVGTNPLSIAIGDLNGDGNADLITANQGSNSVSTLLGDGLGGFSATTTSIGSSPFSVATADFNGDNKVDLSIANNGSNNLSILMEPLPIPTIASFTPTIGSTGTTITITGTNFTGATVVSFGGTPAASFNVVSATSITAVVGSGATGNVSVTTPGGTATLAGFTYTPGPPTITSFTPISGPIGTRVIITGTNFSTTPANNTVRFNGILAVVTASSVTSITTTVPVGATTGTITVTVAGNTGTSATPYTVAPFNLTFPSTLSLTVGPAPREVVVGDIDGDGHQDLVTTNSGNGTTSFLKGIGNGCFESPVNFTTGSNSSGLALADFNADANTDIAVSRGVNLSSLSVLLGNGTSFDPAVNYTTSPAVKSPTHMNVGDINKDGWPDLITANNNFPGSFSILYNNGNGTFATGVDFPSVNGATYFVAVADLNGDTHPDVAIASFGGTASVFMNNGAGGFLPEVTYTSAPGSHYVALKDLNGDNRPEMIVANANANSISVFINNGSGAYPTRVIYPTGNYPTTVSIADMDDDGKLDLVVGNVNGGSVTAFPGDGAGGFGISKSFTVGGQPYSVATGDFDEDGKMDIAAIDFSTNKVNVLISTVIPCTPSITSFTPANGLSGTTVTITGINFSTTPANNLVRFNGTAAVVTASSSTSITTTVPSTATTGPITVTVAGSTGTSATNFFVPICFPANGQNADVVIGQTSFTASTSGSGPNKFGGTGTIAIHYASGKVFVVDVGNNRILRFSASEAATTGGSAEAVLGQPDFTTTTAGLTQSKMNLPIAIVINQSTGTLWVADASNNRILRFDDAVNLPNGANASGVLGQSNFTTNAATPSAVNVGFPFGLALDSNGDLWVGERAWNRVTKFANAASMPNGSAASVVIGQTNFTSTSIGTSPSTLWRPNGVAIDILGNLWVADELNDRVLKFPNAASLPTGASATTVLGQLDFFGNSFATAQNRMYGPIPLHADPFGNLWVGDWANQRVLQFANAASLTNGANATKVLGAPDFNAIYGGTTQNRTSVIGGVAVDHLGNIYIADNANRVLRFNAPVATPTAASACINSSATLMAIGANVLQEYRWYDVPTGGTSLNSSASFTTPPLTATTTYYVSLVDGACSYESARVPVVATAIPGVSAPTVTPASACGPSASLTLTASGGSNGQYRWYDVVSGGTTIVGETNATFTTPVLSTTTTYYVALNNGTCESTRTAVTATINSLPNAPIATNGSRCDTGSVLLTATGGAAGEYRWYDVATGGTPIAGETNATFTTASLNATTTFFVAINNGTCESTRTAVTATIDPLPAAPTTAPANRCDSGTLTLTASGGSAGTYRWYTVASGGTAITGETNASYTTPTLASTTTYYVAINNGTCESARTPVTATINSLPNAPIGTNGSRCDTGSVLLTATGGATGEYRWYDVATGGTAITGETNATYTTPTLASTTTYYVSINTGSCESARTAVTATINASPAAPLTTDANRCDAGTLTLTASGGSVGDYRWYTVATGGTAIAGETNATYTTPTLTTTATYYVAINNGTCESARTAVIATIEATPAAPTAANAARCEAGSVTLTAAGGTPGQYRWYDVVTGGTAFAGETNATLVIASLAVTTTYFVALNNGVCESGRTAVTATVNATPAAPITTGNARCGPGAVTLAATGGLPGEYRWYSIATGGTSIAGETNPTFSPSLTGTAAFYVALLRGGCESTRTEAVATIHPVPAVPVVTSTIPFVSNQLELCPSVSATLTAPAGLAAYTWSTGSTSPAITVSQPGVVTLTVRNAEGCISPPFTVTVVSRSCTPTILPPPPQTIPVEGQLTINITTLITSVLPIVPSSLRVAVAPLSGARASFSPSGELRIDYSGVLFAGRDVLTIEVCNVAGECAQQQISIEVVGDIVIFNGISPNGDGQNDFFYLQYIDVLPAARTNQVAIFNRWGDLVWETTNYNNTDNRFEGLNRSGAELPSGTYYYRIQFASGATERTGFLSLKR